MKRTIVFASRTQKELMRDPLTYIFGIGLPVVLIVLMSVINRKIPGAPFAIEGFAPGMAVFSLAFLSLFGGLLVAKDRCSSFLMRVFASPMRAWEFIAGYSLPLILMALIEGVFCFAAAMAMGLELSVNMLYALAALLPAALMYIALGILMGTLMSDKQVGGIASLIINAATLLSGTWFALDLVGEGFRRACYMMPFAHAVDAVRCALSGAEGIWGHIAVVLGYTALIALIASLCFSHRMKNAEA